MKIPQKSIRWVVLLVVVLFLSNILFGKTGFYALYKARVECDDLKLVVAIEETKIDSLTIVEYRLQNDSEYIERAARELLGVSRPGETVIKFVDRKE